MTSPDMDDEAMKAMARRICANLAKSDVDRELFLAGSFDRFPEMRAALAAIIETQERDAALAEDRYLETDWQEPGQRIAAAIRSGQQFRKDV